jgi:4,5:9,10-diseco-3-hydroxy-5,9,17-trioxoandrosta-1(10),2-diene-4-oate hydrolase
MEVEVGDGHRIHYLSAGSGRPVLFLHGSGPGASGFSNFKSNYPHFAEAGFRALVPDTLGFGRSSKPADVDYAMPFLVEKLLRFLDELGIQRCSVVGNSHGGALAISLALAHPARVERLVLMAPGGLEERETYMKMEGIRAMMKAFLGKGGITREALRDVLRLQLVDHAHLTDELVDERFAVAAEQPTRVLTTLGVPYLAPRLRELSCPVFGLWGMDDRFCPVSGASTIARECAGSRVLLFNACGHWVMVERAAVFNRLCVDFLHEAA